MFSLQYENCLYLLKVPMYEGAIYISSCLKQIALF